MEDVHSTSARFPVTRALLVVVALVVWLYLLFRAYRNRKAIEAAIASVAYEMLKNVLIPNGNGGQIHVHYLLLTQRGLLSRSKDGRRTSYRLTEPAWQVLRRGARRIFAPTDDNAWDGVWTLVAFTLPLDDTNQRRLLRARLRWLPAQLAARWSTTPPSPGASRSRASRSWACCASEP